MWKRLWTLPVKGKIRHFLWRSCHRLLPTADSLIRKGLAIDSTCRSCGEASESLEHMFFFCRKAQLIWQLSPVRWDGLGDHQTDFKRWWRQICLLGQQTHHQDRLELTACLLWSIWKMRNQWLFQALHTPEIDVVNRSCSEWQEFKNLQSRRHEPSRCRPYVLRTRSQDQMRQTPMVGYHVMHTSSISQRLPPISTTGILAYNPQGTLQHSKALVWHETKDVKRLNLEAIRDAQLLAYQLGWNKVIIRNDVQEIVSKLTNHQNFPNELSTISQDIILLSSLFDECRFSCLSRQENQTCRNLSLHALDYPFSVSWVSNHPAWLV